MFSTWHKELKIRAAEEGITLSECLLREAGRVASRPTLAELTERVRRHKLTTFATHSADLIREDRDTH